MSNGKRIVIAGAAGPVGELLSQRLIEAGYEVVVFSSTPDETSKRLTGAVGYVTWPSSETHIWAEAIDGARAVINLMMAHQAKGYKNAVPTTAHHCLLGNWSLVMAMRAAAVRPEVFISSSTVAYYGLTGRGEVTTESAPAGNDAWGRNAMAWEAEAAAADALDVRTALVRTGLVLNKTEDGVASVGWPAGVDWLSRLLHGRYWLPWIHIADAVGLLMLVLEDKRVRGPLNACAPEVVQWRDFDQTLRVVARGQTADRISPRLSTPSSARFYLRRMVPRKALDLGYSFCFPSLGAALADLLKPEALAEGSVPSLFPGDRADYAT